MVTHELRTLLAPFHLLKHPFYEAWMKGTLTTETLQDYASQYYAHVSAFPRYISAVHSKSLDESARKILLENLNDEEGLTHGVSHPELWLRFAEGLSVNRSEVEKAESRAGIQNVITTFFNYAHASFHEGLGALYAYESQVPEIAKSKIEGLKQNYGIEQTRTLEFFEVHQVADVFHREALEKILNELPELERKEAFAAAEVTAKALWDFLSEIHGRSNHEQVC